MNFIEIPELIHHFSDFLSNQDLITLSLTSSQLCELISENAIRRMKITDKNLSEILRALPYIGKQVVHLELCIINDVVYFEFLPIICELVPYVKSIKARFYTPYYFKELRYLEKLEITENILTQNNRDSYIINSNIMSFKSLPNLKEICIHRNLWLITSYKYEILLPESIEKIDIRDKRITISSDIFEYPKLKYLAIHSFSPNHEKLKHNQNKLEIVSPYLSTFIVSQNLDFFIKFNSKKLENVDIKCKNPVEIKNYLLSLKTLKNAKIS